MIQHFDTIIKIKAIIQKETFLKPIDINPVLWTKVFQLYKGGKRKIARLGDYVRVAVRSVKPGSRIKKKKKLIAIITSTRKELLRPDGSYFLRFENTCILHKRRNVPYVKFFPTIIDRRIRRRKIIKGAETVI